MSILKVSKHLRLSLNEIKLATNNFTDKPIGNGGYGILYISGRPTTVAVKTLGEKSWQGLKQFLTEIQLLTGQNHKNVISLLGYCDESKHKSLIYEYAAHGSLDDKWVAKIADLGLSKLYSETSEEDGIVSDACGTKGYCDPKYSDGILKNRVVKELEELLFILKEIDLTSSKDVGSPTSNSYPDDPISKLRSRYEKVKIIFKRFDLNKDGYLDKSELGCILKISSPNQENELLSYRVKNVFHLYSGFIEGDKGLNCDGLFKLYGSGIDCLDGDFEKLNLTLNLLNENEIALRYEKVRRMFQRFDINEDGGLNREELTEFFFTTSENKIGKEAATCIADYTFSVLKEFTDGEKGLTCDGLLHNYEYGADTLDDEFKKLRLHLKPLDDREKALRAEKVRMIFERFDMNKDGGLDKWELRMLLSSIKAFEEVGSYVDKVFRLYAKYIDGDKGLTCDGFFRTYDHGIDSLDVDFETLGLKLRTSIETEDSSRRKDRFEKVRKIFKRFDFNGDGVLDRKELSSFLVATHPEFQPSEEQMNAVINHVFQTFGEFVDGVSGLSCDGLMKNYDCGKDDLEADFEKVKLR